MGGCEFIIQCLLIYYMFEIYSSKVKKYTHILIKQSQFENIV